MSQPVTVSEAQDQLLEIAFDLYRIRQHLHHQFKGLKAQYKSVREYYDAEEEPSKGPCPLELAVAEELDQAVDQLEDIADDLRKASRLSDAAIQLNWRVKQKERVS